MTVVERVSGAKIALSGEKLELSTLFSLVQGYQHSTGDYQYSRKEKYLKALLKRYQIAIFFALTFIISWYPWYTGGHGFKAAGPSYAGLIVVALVGGWKGIVEMLRRLIRWRASIGVWAVALLGPVVITLVAVGLHVLTGGDAPSFTFWKAKW